MTDFNDKFEIAAGSSAEAVKNLGDAIDNLGREIFASPLLKRVMVIINDLAERLKDD
jgi:hypothetical protein